MTVPRLCPTCLTELPEDYPFDHVAIDLALGRRPELFATLARDERVEVVRIGLERGRTLGQLSRHFGWSYADMQALVYVHKLPRSVEVEKQVRRLWEQDLNDGQIGLRLGKHPSSIGKIRQRIGLPTRYIPGGRKSVPA